MSGDTSAGADLSYSTQDGENVQKTSANYFNLATAIALKAQLEVV